jgi:predicted Zn-dependent protease
VTALDGVAEAARRLARPGEEWLATWRGEDSLFVRFNGGKVRQAGRVKQDEVSLRWLRDGRGAVEAVTLSGQADEDRRRIEAAVERLRAALEVLPVDPHLLVSTEATSSHTTRGAESPDVEAVIRTVTEASDGVDLVGFWQSGAVHRGLRSSFGHDHRSTASSWALDFTAVATADRAVKRTVAGEAWAPDRVAAEIRSAASLLPLLRRPPKEVGPGQWRAWLTPVAMGEIVGLLGAFGDLGARAVHTKTSALTRLAAGERALSEKVSWTEDVGGGTSAGFQDDGFVRPDRVPLIDRGRYAGCLTSPRSGLEHGVAHNGADASEMPVALSMAPGDLPEADALAALGTGVWVSNLWYLNHSDRSAGRFTGMTRFATLWVEDGVPVAPLSVMRFDDAIYDLLGSRLEAVGAEAALLPTLDTYGGRSTAAMRLPGVLVSGLTFTL